MSASQLRVEWKHIAVGAVLIAVSSLAGLAVSVSVNDADTLSTVALALAILAFVIQIMMFIAQSWASGQQVSESHALNTETMSALAELRTRAAGTQDILAKQVDTALRFAFERSIVESRKEGLSADEAADRFEEEQGENPPHMPTPSAEDIAIANSLTTYPPEEEGTALLPLFVDLSPIAGSTLKFMSDDERDSRKAGFEPGVRVKSPDSPGVLQLLERGLIEWLDANAANSDSEGDAYVRLTPVGREVARFVSGSGPVPQYVTDALNEAAGTPSQ